MWAKFLDARNYLSKLTFRKVWNACTVYFSYYIARISGNTFHPGMPLSVSIEPTTACNLSCPECPSGLKMFSRPTGNLDKGKFENWLSQFQRHITCINFYFQGEPFIHPHFLEMVTMASKGGIYTSTSTNAHFLSDSIARKVVESGLDRLIVSIDGTSQEVYEQYRINGKLSKVIEGAENVIRWKKFLKSTTPHVIFQFLVVRPNEHQIDEVRSLAKKMGIDEVRLKTAQVYDYENGNPLIPTNTKYSRYRQQKDGTWSVKNKLDDHCWRMWSGCVVTWDGNIVPCCFDKDATHVMGNINDSILRDIWNADRYRNFRELIFRSRSEIDICSNCSEGTKVWISE